MYCERLLNLFVINQKSPYSADYIYGKSIVIALATAKINNL